MCIQDLADGLEGYIGRATGIPENDANPTAFAERHPYPHARLQTTLWRRGIGKDAAKWHHHGDLNAGVFSIHEVAHNFCG